MERKKLDLGEIYETINEGVRNGDFEHHDVLAMVTEFLEDTLQIQVELNLSPENIAILRSAHAAAYKASKVNIFQDAEDPGVEVYTPDLIPEKLSDGGMNYHAALELLKSYPHGKASIYRPDMDGACEFGSGCLVFIRADGSVQAAWEVLTQRDLNATDWRMSVTSD